MIHGVMTVLLAASVLCTFISNSVSARPLSRNVEDEAPSVISTCLLQREQAVRSYAQIYGSVWSPASAISNRMPFMPQPLPYTLEITQRELETTASDLQRHLALEHEAHMRADAQAENATRSYENLSRVHENLSRVYENLSRQLDEERKMREQERTTFLATLRKDEHDLQALASRQVQLSRARHSQMTDVKRNQEDLEARLAAAIKAADESRRQEVLAEQEANATQQQASAMAAQAVDKERRAQQTLEEAEMLVHSLAPSVHSPADLVRDVQQSGVMASRLYEAERQMLRAAQMNEGLET